MAETAQLYYTHSPGDPLPEGSGTAILICLTGDILIRRGSQWAPLPKPKPAEKTPSYRTTLSAGVPRRITYAKEFLTPPNISHSAWNVNDPTNLVWPKITQKDVQGFTVFSEDVDCIFEFSLLEPVII